jgi:hypothetical protein
LLALLRANPLAILAFTGSNELINLAGILGARYALLFAPLSLVQAIGSTTALFVFAFGCLLNAFYPELVQEDLSRRTLIKNGGGTALITAGAVLINF